MRDTNESQVRSCATASASVGRGAQHAALALQSACTCRRKRIAPTHSFPRRRHGVPTKPSERPREEAAAAGRTVVSC